MQPGCTNVKFEKSSPSIITQPQNTMPSTGNTEPFPNYKSKVTALDVAYVLGRADSTYFLMDFDNSGEVNVLNLSQVLSTLGTTALLP